MNISIHIGRDLHSFTPSYNISIVKVLLQQYSCNQN